MRVSRKNFKSQGLYRTPQLANVALSVPGPYDLKVMMMTIPKQYSERARRLSAAGRFFSTIWMVALATGCGTTTATGNPFDASAIPGAAAGEDPIRIEARNRNFNDVTIWAVRQGQRIRLGRVTGKTDETFRINWNVAFPISFEIDVVGGRGCRTGQVAVERSGRVWIEIPLAVGNQPCRAGRR